MVLAWPRRAALRISRTPVALSASAMSPDRCINPRFERASKLPRRSAFAYHAAASSRSALTPRPTSYISPRLTSNSPLLGEPLEETTAVLDGNLASPHRRSRSSGPVSLDSERHPPSPRRGAFPSSRGGCSPLLFLAPTARPPRVDMLVEFNGPIEKICPLKLP